MLFDESDSRLSNTFAIILQLSKWYSVVIYFYSIFFFFPDSLLYYSAQTKESLHSISKYLFLCMGCARLHLYCISSNYN